MRRCILLDSGVLGVLCNPNTSPEVDACSQWFNTLVATGSTVMLPEIADFEVRRELLRAVKPRSLRRLENLKKTLPYSPITTEIMLAAAQLWATARQQGYPTADAKALDADVILAATALAQQRVDREVIVATTNVRHLSRFVAAALWSEI